MMREPPTPPTVRLQGDAVRRIRESKGLTQLYVAESVGVTVDTVSRWENNRTSTVKRDNAAALAKALEAELSEILRTEGDTAAPAGNRPVRPEAEPPEPPRGSRRKWAWGIALTALALGAVALVLFLRARAGLVVRAERRLPGYVAAGVSAPVVVRLWSVQGGSGKIVLREHLPPGWSLVASTVAPDAGPTRDGVVRWILPVSGALTRLAYVVKAPQGAAAGTSYRFQGGVVTPGRSGGEVPVLGDVRVDVEAVHWADDNGDFQVSDNELLDALDRVEAAGVLDLDAAGVRALWSAGGYAWDDAVGTFRPSPGR